MSKITSCFGLKENENLKSYFGKKNRVMYITEALNLEVASRSFKNVWTLAVTTEKNHNNHTKLLIP
jgi:hypothetical protein